MRSIFVLTFFLFFQSCLISQYDRLVTRPFVFMQRTACYGTCPQYDISIYLDGTIIYNGKLFVDKKGCFKSKLSHDNILYLKSVLSDISFFSLDNEYISQITDIPSVITEVIINNQQHKIIDRLNGPRELKNIYQTLDSIVHSVSYWDACSESR